MSTGNAPNLRRIIHSWSSENCNVILALPPPAIFTHDGSRTIIITKSVCMEPLTLFSCHFMIQMS